MNLLSVESPWNAKTFLNVCTFVFPFTQSTDLFSKIFKCKVHLKLYFFIVEFKVLEELVFSIILLFVTLSLLLWTSKIYNCNVVSAQRHTKVGSPIIFYIKVFFQ